MKKNEAYNEVPIKQFMEFFLKSECSMPIEDFECFLLACKNICNINFVENDQEKEKVTTVKLKVNVLRDLILETKNYQKDQYTCTWQQEFKKHIGDLSF